MACLLQACRALATVTGLVVTGGATPMQVARDTAAVASGDWSALIRHSEDDSDNGESAFAEAAEEVHEVAATLLLLLAALHVAGVVLESRALRPTVVAATLAGKQRR